MLWRRSKTKRLLWAFQKAYGFKFQCVSQGKVREKYVIKKNAG